MPCNCNKAKPLPSCVTNLTVGIGTPDTDYKVVFKTPDGRLDTYEATSDDDGNIIVVSAKLRTNTMYEVWVSYGDSPYVAANIHEKVTIEVDGTDITCVFIEFHQAYNEQDIETYANQEITLQ